MNVRDTLFRLAYLATSDPDLAASHVHDVMSSCEAEPQDVEAYVAVLAKKYASDLHDHSPALGWEEWDADLRTDVTTADQLDEDRRETLAWELKRVCLARALASLRPMLRVVFIFVEVHGMSPRKAIRLLNLGPTTLQTRRTRARRALVKALDPICQHLGRGNPCRCAGRVGIALRAGLISHQPSLSKPLEFHAKHATDDIGKLYRHLPIVSL